MKQRVLSMFLCLCMVFTLVKVMVPAAEAIYVLGKDYDNEITANNRFKDIRNKNGAYPCTLYAWQRVYNTHNIELPVWHSAKDWLDDIKLYDEKGQFETGETPRANSIVVYSGSSDGHVAYVEDVSEDGTTMTVSEGGRTNFVSTTGGIALNQSGRATSKGSILWGTYELKGYIYLPTPTPSTPASSTSAPSTPTNITGTWKSTGSQWTAEISWDKSDGATYYNVQYRTLKTNNQWKNDSDYSSGTRYISTGLKDYPYYEYRIQAGNADGKSDWVCYALKKPDVVTPPAKPENLSANWTLSGLVPKICPRVSWGAVSGAEYYEVQYKKATAGSWNTSVTVKSQIAYTFSELDIDTAYDFRVKAVNAGGSSAWSECKLPSLITIKETVAPPPTVAAPTDVSGTWISTGPEWKAKISWNAASGATSYEVQYRTPKTGNAWKADPDYSSGTSYISSGLKDYDSYDYRVRAVNAGGASNWTEYKLEKNASAAPVSPAPGSIQNSSVYIQQADNDGCYVASAAMIISNYRLQNGGSAITYAEAKAANGNSTFFNWGTFGKYGLKDVDLWTSANSGLSGSARAQMVNTALGKNNYGAMLCFKGNGKSHAVVIIGYENGNIIVNDPARSGGGEKIKLTDCKYIRDNITGYVSQEQMLTYANSLTYFVANGSLGSNTEKNPPIETLQPPSAPSGVSGTWTSTGPKWQARISWNAVSGATHYEVQYRTPKTGNAWKTDTDYSSGTSYISTGLADYSSYDYRIRACNAAGASGWTEYTLVKTAGSTNPAPAPTVTEPIVTVPSAPNGVSGTWTSTGPKWQARISWAAVSGATYYEVQYRTPKTGNAWKTDPDYSSGTSYISTGLLDYNSYDYRVRACNSAGASAWTTYTLVKPVSTPPAQTTPAPAPAAPTPTPPSAPSGVSGSWASTGPTWQARISWNAVSGATYYEVQYRTPKTGNEWRADADYSSGTSYISTGLLDYNSYDYRVRACNSAGASAWTTYTLVKTTPAAPAATAPSAPTGISGSWTSMGPTWQARISWAAVSGATRYEVQYLTPKTGNAWRADPDYSSGTSYISTGLMDYSSYDYRVRAVNAAGASAWTEYTLYK